MEKNKKSNATYKTSMIKETWHRLKKNKLAMMGLYILVFVVLVAVFAPWIAPYG